ncbi:MAG: Crp/Fnr family transcriptional regulator [Kiritimatiellia bacterium]
MNEPKPSVRAFGAGFDVQKVPLFAGCTDAQIETLAPYVEAASYRRHEDVYREGDADPCIHIVRKGEVALEKCRGATLEPMRLSIIRPGETFGLGEFMLPAYHTTATALADCELLRITGSDFRRHFLAVESIRVRVLTELSQIAKFLLFAVVAGSGANMLAFYLRRLCLENARETAGKFHIRTKVLQPEIASLLNMSREHVTRLFARLRKEGAVDFNRGYPIVDKPWLQKTVTDNDLADFIVYRDYPR